MPSQAAVAQWHVRDARHGGVASSHQDANFQAAHHGALAALACIWSKEGLCKLKEGPSSTDDIFSVYCEGTTRRASCAHYTVR
eukprot:744237-Pyramimonas_sp.AAC.1